MKHLTEKEITALGWELVKQYTHDQYHTNRYALGAMQLEFTYEGPDVSNISITMDGQNARPISYRQAKILTEVYAAKSTTPGYIIINAVRSFLQGVAASRTSARLPLLQDPQVDTCRTEDMITRITDEVVAMKAQVTRLELALVNEKILTQKLKDTNEQLEFQLRQILIS
jgi:hypothetical protein